MKRFITIIIILSCISGVTFGQVPNQIQYQAVIRDGSGALIKDKLVALKISILRGSETGQAVYSEEFERATSEYGIVSLNIGGDSNFLNIDWSNNVYYLRVEIDIDNGDNYQFMGTSQILTVPYALQALNVTNKDDADANPSNELQTISKNGNLITLSSGGGSVTTDDADADLTNEIQDLILQGNTLTITNRANPTPIDLSAYQGTNSDEQTLSYTFLNNILGLSIEGGTGGNTIQIPLVRADGGTFSGNIYADNLFGVNTGDMSDADVVSAYQSGVDHYYTAADDLKLQFIENFATADMSNGEIVAAYQAGNTDYFNSVDHSKLNSIENGATADLSIGEIVLAYQAGYPQYFNSTTDRLKLNRLSLANNFTVSGGHTVQLNSQATTILTIPTSGTLATESFVMDNAMTNTLIQGRILIGNNSNIATDQTISHDATLAVNGDLTINSIDGQTINLGGLFTTTIDDITLAADPAGSNVTLPQLGTLATQSYVDAQIAAGEASLTSGYIFVGDASDVPVEVDLHGDADLANDGTLTLANSGVTAGTYNSVTVNAKGLITSGSNPTTLSGYGITDALSTTLSDGTFLMGNGSNIATGVSMTGDATITNSGLLTLVNTTVTPGTYAGLVVNSKGLITGGTNLTTLGGYGITDGLSTSLLDGTFLLGNGSGVATGVSMSGDATLNNAGVITLANTVTAGTYTSVTVDAKGRVTTGTTTGAFTTFSASGAVDFNGVVNINDVINLTPIASAPGSPNNGDLYVNSTDNHIYCYLNGVWVQLDNL